MDDQSNLYSSKLPPVALTYQELRDVLAPLVQGYAWGNATIWDLWKLGVPMPQAGGHARLIVPSQLMKWLEDVLNRQGRPLDDAAKLYASMMTRN